jgi:hypothetical protein
MIEKIIQPRYYLYLSSWNFLAVLMHKYIYKHYNLLLSCLIVSIISICIAYITPKEFKVETHDPKQSFVVDGWILRIGDLVFHHIPLIFVLFAYSKYYLHYQNKYGISTITTLFVVTMYLIVFNPTKLYNLDPKYMVMTFVIAIAVYLLLPSNLEIGKSRSHF